MKIVTVITLTGILASTALADTVFDNSQNDIRVRFNPGTLEVGDQIVLAGNARYLTNFSFEYWGTNTIAAGNPLFSGNVQARIKFYKNDGALFNGYASPGTAFWTSDWFSVSPTPRSVLEFLPGVDFAPSSVYLPSSSITWSVQFRGMGPTDTVGVDFYTPAVVGADYPDYWQRNVDGDDTSWALMTNSVSADFAAKMQATLIPTPAIPFIAITRENDKAIVSWPGWATNFLLETTADLKTPPWTPINTGIVWVDNNFIRTNTIGSGNAFFRLDKP